MDLGVDTDGRHRNSVTQECIVKSIISQNYDIKRQNLILKSMADKEASDLAHAKQAARERVLKEFESAQTGLGSLASAAQGVATTSTSTPSLLASASGSGAGVKRKFDLDSSEIERLAQEGEDKAAKKIALELLESSRAKLPNFWLVSLVSA